MFQPTTDIIETRLQFHSKEAVANDTNLLYGYQLGTNFSGFSPGYTASSKHLPTQGHPLGLLQQNF